MFRIGILWVGVLLIGGFVGCGGASGPVTPAKIETTPTGDAPKPGAEPTLQDEGP